MKTLIWYRIILRQTLYDKLVKMGHKEVAARQSIEMKREQSARRIQTCGIDIEEEYTFGLDTQPIYRIPPIEPWNDKPPLVDLLYEKAIALSNDDRKIDCMWSGGIDSTTTLIVLNDVCKQGQLQVILSEGSIKEHPRLYETLVKHLPHRISDGNIRSLIDYDTITVHGNEADTHYGMTGLATPLWKTNTFYFKVRYGHQNRVMRDLGGVTFDKIRIEKSKFKEQDYFIPHTESLFTDWDVTRWFIDMHLRNEIVFNRSPQYGNFKGDTYKEVDEELDEYDVATPEDFLCDDERELHRYTGTKILQSETYQGLKMELRDFIMVKTGDKEYAYGKGDTASYSHGQIDMFNPDKHPHINPNRLESRNVAICLDGTVIKRDELNSLDPYDFIIP